MSRSRIRGLALVAVMAACGTNTDSYRKQWCATYCTAGSRAAACDSECGLEAHDAGVDGGQRDSGRVDAGLPDSGAVDSGAADAGHIDAGSPDAGTKDAGTNDAGDFDAGALDAGGSDAGPADAGGALDAGYIAVLMGDGGALELSAGSCARVTLGVFDTNGFPIAGMADVSITSVSDTVMFTTAACSGSGTSHPGTALSSSGIARVFLRSPTYGPQHFGVQASNGARGSFDVNFTARAVMHAAASASCAEADVSIYSSDGEWTRVGPPPGSNDEYVFFTDAGEVSVAQDSLCNTGLLMFAVPSTSEAHFYVGPPDGGLTVMVQTRSPFVAPASVLVSADPNTGNGFPGDSCAAGCVAGGCVIESTPVCECIAQGQPCVLGAVAGAGCCNPSSTMDICGGSTSICE